MDRPDVDENRPELLGRVARDNPLRPVWSWLDERLGLSALNYPVSAHANTIMYTLGGVTLVGFLILAVTGFYMAQFYHPHPNDARESLVYMVTRVDFGNFVRTVHFWASNLVVVTMFLHMLASLFGSLPISPNPPMDRDGRREDSGRGEGVTGAMIRARIWVDGRLAGGLQAFLGAPMAAYSGCGERDGGIGHGKRRSRTGLARVCGDVGLAGGSVADGRRQAGSGITSQSGQGAAELLFPGPAPGKMQGQSGVPSG